MKKMSKTLTRQYAFSRSNGRSGLPLGDVKSPPNTIRLEPTLRAIDVNAVI